MQQKKKFLVMRVPRISENEMFESERTAYEAVDEILKSHPGECLYVVNVHFNSEEEDNDEALGRGRPN
jgi:hypothetical protein